MGNQESLNKRVRETVSELSDEDLSDLLRAPKEEFTPFARKIAAQELTRRGQMRARHSDLAASPHVNLEALRESFDNDKHAGCYLEVWSEKNFEGEHLRIDGPIERQTLDFTDLDWCNSISSLRVGPTAFVLVYAEKNFNGATMSFGPGDDVPDLEQFRFNDEIDSIRLVNSLKVFDGVHVEDTGLSNSHPSPGNVKKATKHKNQSRRNR